MAIIFSLILLLTGQSLLVSGSFNVAIDLEAYRNPSHQLCNGALCDGRNNACNNRFQFCLRTLGTQSSPTTSACGILSRTSDSTIKKDVFSFSSNELAELNLPNPIIFDNIVRSVQSVSLMLSIEIIHVNSETAETDKVIDIINIDFPKTMMINDTIPVASYSSTECNKAIIDLSYRITSNCPENMYGFECGSTCIPKPERYYCNYLGQRICKGNFAGPNCASCLPYHYPINKCDKVCTSRDDNRGHYSCNTDGSRTCLRNFDGPDCLACKKDFYGIDCMKTCKPSSNKFTCSKEGNIVCNGNFRGPDCDKCREHYYGQTCSVYCRPKINQFNCIPEYPHHVCLGNYAGPQCSECRRNHYKPSSGCIHYCKSDETTYCNEDGVKVARPGECDFGPWQCASYGVVIFIMLAVMVFCLFSAGQNT